MIIYKVVGEIYSSLDIVKLILLLIDCDLQVELRDSAQKNKNTYIKIKEGIPELFIENWDDVYSIEGWSDSLDRVYQAAEKVSFALTYLDIPHAFEIYIDSDNSKTAELIYYLEYSCPP